MMILIIMMIMVYVRMGSEVVSLNARYQVRTFVEWEEDNVFRKSAPRVPGVVSWSRTRGWCPGRSLTRKLLDPEGGALSWFSNLTASELR